MKFKSELSVKIALLTGLLSLGLLGCPVQPEPCVPSANVSGCGVTGSFATTTSTQIVPKATVDAVTATQIDVNSEPTDKPFAAGQFVVSDAGDGLVRQISSVTSQSSMVGSRLIKKVYIQTTNASLEDVISSGEAGIEYGGLDFNQATVLSALPGVQTRAVNGALPFKDTVIPIGNGATLKVSGSITQTLNPKFNLKFSNGSMEKLEIGLSGGFGVSMTGKLTATAKIAALTADFEKELVSYRFTRAFLVGVVPVVVVIEPKLIVGAAASANEPLTVTAGISPNVNLNFSIKYDRAATNKWTIVEPTASFSANPTFDISTPSGAKTKAYAKLALSMKFYGVVGPEIETKPFSVVTIVPGQTTKINTGITLSGTVSAGFKVLGKNLSLSTSSVSSNALTANYNCTSASCIIAAANPLPEFMR
jgi:hypothetical protein